MDHSIALHQFRNLVSHVFRLTMSLRQKSGDPSKHFDEFLNTTLAILQEKERAVQVHNALERHADAVFSDVILGRQMFEPEPVSPRLHVPRIHESGPTLVIHHDSNPAPMQAPDVIVTKADEDAGLKMVTLDAVSSTPGSVIQVEPADDEDEEGDVVEEAEDEEDEDEEDEAADEDDAADDDEGEVVEEVEDDAADDDEGEVVEEVEDDAADDDEGEVVEEFEDDAADDDEGEVVEEDEAADDDDEGEVVEEVEDDAADEEVVEETEMEEEGVELVKIGRKQYFVGENSKLVYEAIDEDTPGDEPLGRFENGKIIKL